MLRRCFWGAPLLRDSPLKDPSFHHRYKGPQPVATMLPVPCPSREDYVIGLLALSNGCIAVPFNPAEPIIISNATIMDHDVSENPTEPIVGRPTALLLRKPRRGERASVKTRQDKRARQNQAGLRAEQRTRPHPRQSGCENEARVSVTARNCARGKSTQRGGGPKRGGGGVSQQRRLVVLTTLPAMIHRFDSGRQLP